jgi:hypothetical protein
MVRGRVVGAEADESIGQCGDSSAIHTPRSRSEMTTIDVTLGRAFRIWWSYFWRSMVLSTLV